MVAWRLRDGDPARLNDNPKMGRPGEESAERKKLSIAEVRGTVANSLTVAFGFVIAPVWNNVVLGALSAGSISLTAGTDAVGVAYRRSRPW
jgi:hypothetical protein